MAGGRYGRLIRQVREAAKLSRTGALVLDEGTSVIYFLWGQPTHATFKDGDELLEGDAALKRISLSLAEPGKIAWDKRLVRTTETLRITVDDLVETLEEMEVASHAGGMAVPEPQPPERWSGTDRRRGAAIRYTLEDFPPLPQGPPLWEELPTSVLQLDVLIANLDTAVIALEGPRCRGIGVVRGGQRYDAYYLDDEGSALGDPAWERLIAERSLGSSITGFELEPSVAEALSILWRGRLRFRDLDVRWLDPEPFLEAMHEPSSDRVIVITATEYVGIALIVGGEVVGAYSTGTRTPMSGFRVLRHLFADAPDGLVTILERAAEPPIDVEHPREVSTDAPEVTASVVAEAVDAATEPDSVPAVPLPSRLSGPMPEPEPPQEPEEPAVAMPEPVSPTVAAEAPERSQVTQPRGERADAEPAEPPPPEVMETTVHAADGEPADTEAAELPREPAGAAAQETEPVPAESELRGSDIEPVTAPEPVVRPPELEAAAQPMVPPMPPSIPVQSLAAASPDRASASAAAIVPASPEVPDPIDPGLPSALPAWQQPAAQERNLLDTGLPDVRVNDLTAILNGSPAAAPPPRAMPGPSVTPSPATTPLFDLGGAGHPHGLGEQTGFAPRVGTEAEPLAPRGGDGGAAPRPLFDLGAAPEPVPDQGPTDYRQARPPEARTDAAPPSGGAVSGGFAPKPALNSVNFDEVVEELISMGRAHLGPGFDFVTIYLNDAERSTPGLRAAIAAIRQTDIPGHSSDEVNRAARAMLAHVADRCSGA